MAADVWAKLSGELSQVSAEAGKSVVAVHGRRHPASGIIFGRNAVVTANHAVRRDEDITVILGPGNSVNAAVAGRDSATDLVVLRFREEVTAPLPKWSSAASSLRVGDLTLALGRTWRGNVVASAGIISGLIDGPWRTWRGGELDQFIRPDLTLYPGFSGGPLLNSEGQFVGMNTAGLHRAGITVPAATVVRIATELLEKGRVEKPYLGLAMHAVPLPESLRSKLNLIASEGLLVAHVEPSSPAEKAGVLLGDVLTELAGKPVSDTDGVQETLRSHAIGSEVSAGLLRGGTALKLSLKLEARPLR